MFCKRIPLVFQKELYAGVSFASAVLYIALQHYVSNHDVVIISTGIRLLPVYWRYVLSWDYRSFTTATKVTKVQNL